MWLADLLKKFTIFYLKVIVALAFACVVLQMLAAWWHGVHITGPSTLALVLVLAGISLAAHRIRESRRKPVRHVERHKGAERTPLMPQRGGAAW